MVTVRRDDIRASDLPPRVTAESVAAREAILVHPRREPDFDVEIRRLEVALLSTALRRTDGSKAAGSRGCLIWITSG